MNFFFALDNVHRTGCLRAVSMVSAQDKHPDLEIHVERTECG